MKPELSGGVIYDLHIHDCDMIRWVFGEPKAFSAIAQSQNVHHDTAFITYYYDNLPVCAVADWSLKGIPFNDSYRVGFEKATVIYEKGGVNVYSKEDGSVESVKFDAIAAIEGEIKYFIGCLEKGVCPERNMPESSALTVAVAELLLESADQGGKRIDFKPMQF